MTATALYGLPPGSVVRSKPLRAYGVGTQMDDPTVLAFDPGGTTGWALASYDESTGVIYNFHFGQLTGDHHSELWMRLKMALAEFPHLRVVAEDYRPEFGRAQNHVALEYLGVMTAFCRQNLVEFVRQGREIKPFWTSDRLRRLGMWPTGQPHAQDATRHWLAYVAKTAPLTVTNEIYDRIR